jgi:hypothetical protein
VLSEKKILNETKKRSPPLLQVKWPVPKYKWSNVQISCFMNEQILFCKKDKQTKNKNNKQNKQIKQQTKQTNKTNK